MNVRTLIDRVRQKCLDGVVPDRDEIIRLAGIDDTGEDCDYLRRAASEVARIKTGGKAYLWGAVGIDFVPCEMSCDFCSFGSEWGIVTENKIYTPEEIAREANEYVQQKVHYLVLRSTQFYKVEDLLRIVAYVREHVKGDYELILNIGEFDVGTANRLYEAGVDGIYHALRLREGTDTRFDVANRRKTLAAIRDSELKLIHLVEPVGEEHTAAEIADRFLEALSYGACISGIMARIPVAGTPLGGNKRIGDRRIAKLVAVTRLSGGGIVSDICVHPASLLAVESGANVAVVEKGAIPRDTTLSSSEWNNFNCSDAAKLFTDNGYIIS